MRQALLLGVDVGTTACKTVLVDQAGGIVDSQSEGYPLCLPAPRLVGAGAGGLVGRGLQDRAAPDGAPSRRRSGWPTSA
jgi:glycerol kinase